jgi:putative oxidoreductase
MAPEGLCRDEGDIVPRPAGRRNIRDVTYIIQAEREPAHVRVGPWGRTQERETQSGPSGIVMKSNLTYGLQLVLGALFVAAGAAKLAGLDLMVREFELIGLGQGFRLVVGTIEIVGGLLLFVPRAAVLGAILVASVMVGAFGATVAHVATTGLAPVPVNAPLLTTPRSFEAKLPVAPVFGPDGLNI